MVDDSNDKTNFTEKLLLAERHVFRLCKSFANNSSVDIKLLRPRFFKIEHLRRYIRRLLETLVKTCFIINVKCT